MFGRKKSGGGSTLIVDVENGSVGAALVHSSLGEPRLFGETRVAIPIQQSRDTRVLVTAIEKGVREALQEVSLVAARLRNHAQTRDMGAINSAHIFLSAPWGSPNLEQGRSQFVSPMQNFLRDETQAFVGEVPTNFHTGADAAVYGLNRVAPHDETLLVIVRDEIAEIVLLQDGVAGFGTVPHGHHLLIRTMQTHGGLSQAEAHSALELGKYPSHFAEPLASAGEQFAEHFADVAHQLMQIAPASQVVVLGESQTGPWFARALTQSPHVHNLFPHGGEVRSFGAHHVAPHVASHQGSGDLFILLDALFAHATV